jgi:Galactoside-binding lectin
MLYHLHSNGNVQLGSTFKPGSIAIIRSSKLAFSPTQDKVGFSFTNEKGDIVLRIGIRPREDAVVFNTKPADSDWGSEERVAFSGKFKNANPSITVYDHGDRFQVLFDGSTVIYFNKRLEGDVTAIAYDVYGQEHALSDPLTVDVFGSLSSLT